MIAFVEYISVFEFATHRRTNAQKCHDAMTRLIKLQPSTPLSFETSGRRSIARSRSSGDKYLAVEDVGVSGKQRKP